jgi:hypothetical protein
MNSKYWGHSKTILFNAAVVLLTVFSEHSDLVKGLLPNMSYNSVMLLVAIGNTYLRFVTSAPITLKK